MRKTALITELGYAMTGDTAVLIIFVIVNHSTATTTTAPHRVPIDLPTDEIRRRVMEKYDCDATYYQPMWVLPEIKDLSRRHCTWLK